MDSNLFCFFVSGNKDRIFPDSELWQMPLSGKSTRFSILSKKDLSRSTPDFHQSPHSDAITIGDYLSACKRFLISDDCHYLKFGLEFILGKSISLKQFKRIDLYLEKHGAFYHPVKVVVSIKTGQMVTLVLNGAVSTKGLGIIEKEYSILSRLYGKSCLNHNPGLHNTQALYNTPGSFYLPAVFGVDILTESKGKFGFFLGEWFDGFKEFHATGAKNSNQIVVWSGDGTCDYISLAKSLPVYQTISKILTHYYNIETFEQIFPWHHAAGDFIIKQDGDQFQVRLITVRDYVSLLECEIAPGNANAMILPGLLMFFLNLSLKIRLDRLDGIGELVFLDPRILDAAIHGFLESLDEKTSLYDHGDIGKAFIGFIQQFEQVQIQEMIKNLLETQFPDPLEKQLIESCLNSHSERIVTAFQPL